MRFRFRPRHLFTSSIALLLATGAVRAADSTPAPGPRPASTPAPDFARYLTFDKLPKDMKVEDNVVYKTVNGQDLKLTVFYPKVKKFEKAPLLVYIHGGGWGHGNRFVVEISGGIDVVRQLNDAGVVCVTIEYRLVNGQSVVAMDSEADCRDAIHFMVENAARFGIDPQRIATMGGSAGGHLSLVTALGDDKDYPCDPALAKYPGRIVAEAADFPLVSLVDPSLFKGSNFERPGPLNGLLGGPLDEHRDAAEKLSPTLLLKPGSPAIFVAHGDHDHVLNVANAYALAKACQEKGVPVELVIVKNADHGFSGKNIDPPLDEISRRTAVFLLKYLLPGAQ
jgi:acetyl esterase/lipase